MEPLFLLRPLCIPPHSRGKYQGLPQLGEAKATQPMDASGEHLMYEKAMIRAYLDDAKPEERCAPCPQLSDLKMEVVGQAAVWSTTLDHVPVIRKDMLLVDCVCVPDGLLQLLKNSEGPPGPRWSLASSAMLTPVRKPRSAPAPAHLSGRVRCLSVWPNACEESPLAFLFSDSNWLMGKT